MDPLGPEIASELSRFGPQAGMADLVERWPRLVGAAIARNAWPARIARDGTVHVNTADSVWAFELGQRSLEIAEKLDVPKLRFAPGPLPELGEELVENAISPTPEDEERARAIAAAITDENLRERVQKAVCFSLARGRDDSSI
jgi:Dna[CI] antecedent, DciA